MKHPLTLLAPFVLSTLASAQSFTLVGHAPGALQAKSGGLSADGRVASGHTYRNSPGAITRAYAWSADTGRVDIDPLWSDTATHGYGISGDGRVVVGMGDSQTAPAQAFRWEVGVSYQRLGVLPGYVYSYAADANHDGSVIVGRNILNPQVDPTETFARAFRWTSTTGMVGLQLPGYAFTEANAVSADGNVIIGRAKTATVSTAFRWTTQSGFELLPALVPGTSSYAFGLSPDGLTAVGFSGNIRHPVMWRDGQVIDLGSIPEYPRGLARAVNSDGTVVVGASDGSGTGVQIANIWTSARGLEPLASYLAFHGVTIPAGVHLYDATAVSDDGMTITGFCGPPGSVYQSFVVTIPSPGACIPLCGLGLVLFSRNRGRRNR